MYLAKRTGCTVYIIYKKNSLLIKLTVDLLTNIFRTRGNKILESKCSRWSTIALCCRSFGYNESFCPYFPTKYAAIA